MRPRASFVKGQFRESEKLAQELVRENPRDVNAALLLARLAMMANCYEDAREPFSSGSSTSSRDSLLFGTIWAPCSKSVMSMRRQLQFWKKR